LSLGSASKCLTGLTGQWLTVCFKCCNLQNLLKCLFTPPLDDIRGPFTPFLSQASPERDALAPACFSPASWPPACRPALAAHRSEEERASSEPALTTHQSEERLLVGTLWPFLDAVRFEDTGTSVTSASLATPHLPGCRALGGHRHHHRQLPPVMHRHRVHGVSTIKNIYFYSLICRYSTDTYRRRVDGVLVSDMVSDTDTPVCCRFGATEPLIS